MGEAVAPDYYPPLIRCSTKTGAETLHYSILYEGLPDEFRRVAERELNETEEKREKEMKRLKGIMKSENLDCPEDIYILGVLRACKYNSEKSEAKLKKFTAAYKEAVNMIVDLDLAKAEKIIDDMCFGIAPYRDSHGRYIIYTWPCGANLNQYSFYDVAICCLSCVLFQLTFPITTVAGLVYVADGKLPSMTMFYPIFKLFMQYTSTFLSFPLLIKRVDIINKLPIIYWAFRLISAFLPDKIVKRVYFHGAGYERLHKVHNPKILPEHFGGALGPNTSQFYKERLLNFIRELKFKHPQK